MSGITKVFHSADTISFDISKAFDTVVWDGEHTFWSDQGNITLLEKLTQDK